MNTPEGTTHVVLVDELEKVDGKWVPTGHVCQVIHFKQESGGWRKWMKGRKSWSKTYTNDMYCPGSEERWSNHNTVIEVKS